MRDQEKAEQTLTRLLNDEDHLTYPDFEAMWDRIEPHLPGSKEKLLPVVQQATGRKNVRGSVLIVAAVVLVVATPVFAAITYNWDNYLYRNGGIQSALQQGLGQSLEKSVKQDGVNLTVHTAVVDENRTVLLFSVNAPNVKSNQLARFAEMSLKTVDGRMIEGNHRLMWDNENKVWRGTFEAQWTPETVESDVQLLAQDLQFYSAAEQVVPFQSSDDQLQSFDIKNDGIQRIVIQPFVQGDKILLASSVFFNQPEVKNWASPSIGVYKGSIIVNEASHGFYGKPGEQGEYTFQQFYHAADLTDSSLIYKLLYLKKDQEVGNKWSFDLQLNKQQMVSGTIKRELNIPIESGAGKMTLKQMVVTPTRIRIMASHEKNQTLVFKKHRLEVDGKEIQNGNTFQQKSPEETDFYFEVPPNVKITEHTPIALVMNYEVLEHSDEKAPIILKDISTEKKTMTTQVGGFSVQWTYYKQNGDLFVQSEAADPNFGGINQTYIIKDGKTMPGKQVTTNFTGDGNNQAIDVYKDYQEKDAAIYIYWYYTDNPDKGLRVELNR
ncbi:DUF4179 domain-containing protein [Paenibacillus agricola]|uniref:DUF4179 domain-containing protein n=1 Tax=Paenibacillus agricola TaxID=2716264 RepID=A0ABX0JET9_9BACL|nr:DUF4179 domain-containing protein [Paenibacillus agricola]NHN34418.1 DUF4179 domain-containing protein [Paenibacillus agricola]